LSEEGDGMWREELGLAKKIKAQAACAKEE